MSDFKLENFHFINNKLKAKFWENLGIIVLWLILYQLQSNFDEAKMKRNATLFHLNEIHKTPPL